MQPKSQQNPSWTFFSNHGHVVFLLAQHPEITLKEIATRVGVTERSITTIVKDLEEGGYLKRSKIGRRNVYSVRGQKKLRHSLESKISLKDIVTLFKGTPL